MKKKILCLILSLTLLLPLLMQGVQAQEHRLYKVYIDAGQGTREEWAIYSGGDLYIPAESFGNYTYFQYDSQTNTFLMEGQEENRAFKKVIINPQTKKVGVVNRIFDLEDCFIVDGKVYLPFCQMMPILNGQIIAAEDGVIQVANPKVTLASVLYDFHLNDYYFDLYEEFYGQAGLLAGFVLPSYLFNSVADFRLDRLDFVFDSGTFEDYREIISGYLRDEGLFLKANQAHDDPRLLLGLVNLGTKATEPLNDVMDWAEDLKELDLDENDPLFRGVAKELVKNLQEIDELPDYTEDADDLIKTWHDDSKGISIAEFFELFEYVYVYCTHVEDNHKMLDAVYNITSGGNYRDVQYRAAAAVYDLYGEDVLPAMTDRVAKELLEEQLGKTVLGGKLKLYELTAKISGKAWELVIPGDTKDIGVLSLHAGVADSARMSAAAYDLNSETAVEDYRLSLLLMMLASRECYKIMADTFEAYGYSTGEYQAKIEKLETKIMALYLAADNLEYEALDNLESLAEKNKKLLREAGFVGPDLPAPSGETTAPTEAPTEVPTEAPTEAPTEVPTEAPTEAPTEPPTEAPTERPDAEEEFEVEAGPLHYYFLAEHPEYNYYALLDINRDGTEELLVCETTVNPDQMVDIWVNQGGIYVLAYEDIWVKVGPMTYNRQQRWVENKLSGTGGGGMEFFYLDESGNIIWESFEHYEWCGGLYNGEPADIWEEYMAYEALEEAYDPEQSEQIIFLPRPH